MDMETIQKNYGVTDADLQKILQYTAGADLENAGIQKDFEAKRWFVEKAPNLPSCYEQLTKGAAALGFDISSDNKTGELLALLAASKPKGNFLEIGTGCGLGASWLLQGMCDDSKLVSIETNASWLEVAQKNIKDKRARFINGDAAEFITSTDESFDLIFADALPGKYFLVDEVISLLKPGGFYIVDDCIHQEKWPKEVYIFHRKLSRLLEKRTDLRLLSMDWSVGVTIGVKIEA